MRQQPPPPPPPPQQQQEQQECHGHLLQTRMGHGCLVLLPWLTVAPATSSLDTAALGEQPPQQQQQQLANAGG